MVIPLAALPSHDADNTSSSSDTAPSISEPSEYEGDEDTTAPSSDEAHHHHRSKQSTEGEMTPIPIPFPVLAARLAMSSEAHRTAETDDSVLADCDSESEFNASSTSTSAIAHTASRPPMMPRISRFVEHLDYDPADVVFVPSSRSSSPLSSSRPRLQTPGKAHMQSFSLHDPGPVRPADSVPVSSLVNHILADLSNSDSFIHATRSLIIGAYTHVGRTSHLIPVPSEILKSAVVSSSD